MQPTPEKWGRPSCRRAARGLQEPGVPESLADSCKGFRASAGTSGRGACPPSRHRDHLGLVRRPVMQRLGGKVGTVGPDERVGLRVDGDLVEQRKLLKGTEQSSSSCPAASAPAFSSASLLPRARRQCATLPSRSFQRRRCPAATPSAGNALAFAPSVYAGVVCTTHDISAERFPLASTTTPGAHENQPTNLPTKTFSTSARGSPKEPARPCAQHHALPAMDPSSCSRLRSDRYRIDSGSWKAAPLRCSVVHNGDAVGTCSEAGFYARSTSRARSPPDRAIRPSIDCDIRRGVRVEREARAPDTKATDATPRKLRLLPAAVKSHRRPKTSRRMRDGVLHCPEAIPNERHPGSPSPGPRGTGPRRPGRCIAGRMCSISTPSASVVHIACPAEPGLDPIP
jgi:hypothetical protein